MSSSKDAQEHPLTQNWANQTDKKRPMDAPTVSSRSDVDRSINLKHQQFARKRRDSILKMADYIPDEKQRKLAIKCENVCLTYGEGEHTNYVLNGLTLSVPKGEIYGLLGPSGCGKTSLLKIICGLQKVEYGTVKLFGFKPGTLSSGVPGPGIGYMPQELALQSDLTIGEMLAFYGRLCLLDEKTIAKQTDYLVNLLELPPKDRFIASLSGGQKRRVSLAVTIVHKPRLVILDEPTVGVDPILCQKIWELLINLSVKEKMTIVITTHYIEETKRANLVGFMRKGQILAEGSPEHLMEYYDADSLENVFYKLCLNQKQRKTTVQHTHPARRRSIIRSESIKSAAGHHRLSLKRNSEIQLNKQVQELTPKNKPKFSRQGSFTSSFGEYQQQQVKFQESDRTSKYSTPIGSPQTERDNQFDSNNNQALLKKKTELEQEQQLELKLIDSQKYKKKPLEDISMFPIHWERFKAHYDWNPILTWMWLALITSYKLALQTIRQPLFLLILYIFPTFCVASLYLCIGHTPKGIKVGLILDEVKDHRHRWPGFPNIPCNPKDRRVDYDYLFKLYDDLGYKNRTKTGDYEFDYIDVIDGIGTYDKLRVPYIPEILLGFMNREIVNFVNYSTVEEAKEAVRTRKIWSYLHFKKEFSRSFIERDMFLKASNPKKITNEMIDQGSIHINGDFSDLFMMGSIQLTVLEALVDTYPVLAKQCGVKPKSVKPPLEIGEFIYGEYIKGDYFGVRDFAAPGFIMCITYSLSMGLSTLQTMLELQDKMFIRNFSVGLSAGQMIAANILGRILFLIGSVATMLLSAVMLFQIPIYGSYFDAFHILVLQTLVGMTNGLFFATLIVDLTACLFTSIGFLLLIFFISGVFWPLEALPYYIRWFSRSMPFTVPGEAFRTVLIRKGAPVSYIYPGILMSYVWLFVFLSLSYWSVKRKKYE